MKKIDDEEIDRVTLRIPSAVFVELKVMAARGRRSLNAQIVSILEKEVSELLK